MISRLGLLVMLLLMVLNRPAFGAEESITLPQGERFLITVPDQLEYRVVNQNNTVFAEITDAARTVILQLRFLTHPGSQLDTVEQQQALIANFSHDDIEQSVEQKLIFKNLTTSALAGQYVVVTDGNLVGHAPPPGQYLKLTRGVKVAPEYGVFFSILSQDETSRAYQAALRIARDGVHAK